MLNGATPTRHKPEAAGPCLTMRAAAQRERSADRSSPHGHDHWHHADQRQRPSCAKPRRKENLCLRKRPTGFDANDEPSSLDLP